MKPSDELKEGTLILYNKHPNIVRGITADATKNAVFLLVEDMIDHGMYDANIDDIDYWPSCPHYKVLEPMEVLLKFVRYGEDTLVFAEPQSGMCINIPHFNVNLEVAGMDFEPGKGYLLTFGDKFLLGAETMVEKDKEEE